MCQWTTDDTAFIVIINFATAAVIATNYRIVTYVLVTFAPAKVKGTGVIADESNA